MKFSTEFSEKFFEGLMSDYQKTLDHSGVNGERLAYRLAKLSEIGLTNENGSSRMGFSKEERQAKELVKTWMTEAGLTVMEDGAGNVFGRFAGKEIDAKTVMSGSHVDSVPNGGHFDGTLGVLAALEVVEAWKSTGFQPDKSLEVAIFTDEEGSRFNGGLSGSSAMVGDVKREEQEALVDVHGTGFKKVIEKDGLSIDRYFASKRKLEEISAFVEVHIEQGKQLEKEDLPVGVVTGIAGPCWLEITFLGEAGHAGNTPMNDRNDALIGASLFVAELEKLPSKISPTAVATVGKFEVFPNGINVIPGKVKLTVDIRDIHEETRNSLIDSTVQLAHLIANDRKLVVTLEENIRITPVPITFGMQAKVMKAIEENDLKAYLLPSGAGHDAMIIGRHLPVAMLFVRSKKGISHSPKEWSSLQDCVQSVHVLKTMLEDLTKE